MMPPGREWDNSPTDRPRWISDLLGYQVPGIETLQEVQFSYCTNKNRSLPCSVRDFLDLFSSVAAETSFFHVGSQYSKVEQVLPVVGCSAPTVVSCAASCQGRQAFQVSRPSANASSSSACKCIMHLKDKLWTGRARRRVSLTRASTCRRTSSTTHFPGIFLLEPRPLDSENFRFRDQYKGDGTEKRGVLGGSAAGVTYAAAPPGVIRASSLRRPGRSPPFFVFSS